MISRLFNKLRRFRRDEDGMATIEFIMWFPLYMMVTYSGVELGIVAYNHSNLERALDETIQDVRMNRISEYDASENAQWTHALIKEIICDKAIALPNCTDRLAVEMTSVNPFRNDNAILQGGQNPYCVDNAREVEGMDDQIFTTGTANELMIIRACIEIKPLFVGTTLGRLARKDPDGHYELHATTVFVHEPA